DLNRSRLFLVERTDSRMAEVTLGTRNVKRLSIEQARDILKRPTLSIDDVVTSDIDARRGSAKEMREAAQSASSLSSRQYFQKREREELQRIDSVSSDSAEIRPYLVKYHATINESDYIVATVMDARIDIDITRLGERTSYADAPQYMVIFSEVDIHEVRIQYHF